MWEKILGWVVNIFKTGERIEQILSKQEQIEKKLAEIERAIDSPQNKLALLESERAKIDLLRENNAEEIRKLEADKKGQIDKHRTKIEELQEKNEELTKYGKDFEKIAKEAIEIIKDKNKRIDGLYEEISMLRQKAPPSLLGTPLGQAILGQQLASGKTLLTEALKSGKK